MLIFLLLAVTPELRAYSVLTHQAMIDAAWEKNIVPVLEEKYPGASLAELKEAHAYAYGGAIMPDMGYYPLGSVFFTDLVHYVRTGDFTRNLIGEATTRNELAFALGALAHYHGDIHGHKLATNRSVPLVYPKSRKYFGQVVTYEEDPVAHMRMEFGFDVLQAARGNYAPQAYRDFIGFKVAREVLERAFYKTYGLKLSQIFVYLPLAERVFRFAVKALLPQITKIGWQFVNDEVDDNEGVSADQKVADLVRNGSFQKQYGNKQDEPGVSARLMAAVLRFMPKVGLLETLKFELPTAEAEKLFATSFDAALENYISSLEKMPAELPELNDYDLDTGLPAHLGEYQLADRAFARLLKKLADEEFETAPEPLRTEALQYFAGLPPPPDYRKEKKQYRKTKASLELLEQLQKPAPGN